MEWILGSQVGQASKMSEIAAETAMIDRCRRQDPHAFGEFVDQYQARVYGFVRRMLPNPDDAADLTQEVFIRAFQNFARFDARSSVRTWLFRIAHNLCIDRVRKTARSPRLGSLTLQTEEGEEFVDVVDERWQPEQVALDDELAKVLEDGIATMSEKLRSVLLLHDREALPYEEIAEMLSIPVGTVKSRLFLARAHLQQVLTRYWNDEPAKCR